MLNPIGIILLLYDTGTFCDQTNVFCCRGYCLHGSLVISHYTSSLNINPFVMMEIMSLSEHYLKCNQTKITFILLIVINYTFYWSTNLDQKFRAHGGFYVGSGWILVWSLDLCVRFIRSMNKRMSRLSLFFSLSTHRPIVDPLALWNPGM
jgi:hypothetical protein